MDLLILAEFFYCDEIKIFSQKTFLRIFADFGVLENLTLMNETGFRVSINVKPEFDFSISKFLVH